MHTVKKIVGVYRKYGSLFSKMNKASTQEGNNFIGGSINGKREIMLREDEMKAYMPTIVGVQPTNPDFLKKVNDHWESLSVFIPEAGRQLEIGFVYDITAESKKAAINALAASKKTKVETDEELAALVEENIAHVDKWKYAFPISVEDYSLWRYCLNYGDVANDISLVEKSTRIRFYLHDESKAQLEKETEFKLRNQAGAKYYEVISKPEEVENILYAANIAKDIHKLSASQKAQMLEMYKNTQPAAFIKLVDNEDIKEVAYIERLIAKNILTRDITDGMITNPMDGMILGKTTREVVYFLKDAANAKLANELQGRMKNS